MGSLHLVLGRTISMVGNSDREPGDSRPAGGEGTPVCLKCLRPIDPAAYYCPKCGAASSALTPYIPFVNIRYNYSIFGRLWRKVWYEKSGLLMKLFGLFLIIVCVPIMLIGLPFVLWRKIRGKPDHGDVNQQ
jgi:hypothetical protein